MPAVSLASVAQSGPESTDDGGALDDEPEPAALQGASVAEALATLAARKAEAAHVTPNPAPQRRPDDVGGYDPLRGFNPGATRRF